MTFKIDISEFYVTKVNPNNGNETKSDIFPLDISNLKDHFLSKCQWLSKFLSFMTKMNPNNGTE